MNGRRKYISKQRSILGSIFVFSFNIKKVIFCVAVKWNHYVAIKVRSNPIEKRFFFFFFEEYYFANLYRKRCQTKLLSQERHITSYGGMGEKEYGVEIVNNSL